jgi:DNA-binding NarL/FixJ family response regulator
MPIRVLLADDEALVRGGFRMILESQADIEVVGEADDGRCAVREAERLRPDVVVMDIQMPGTDGITATREIVSRLADPPRVLVVTTFDVDEYVYDALRGGASGFLLKNSPPEELARAVRVVSAGESLLSPSITRRLIEDVATRPRAGSAAPRRSPSSPNASAKSCCSWPAASPTPRSPSGSSSRSAPSRRTLPGC